MTFKEWFYQSELNEPDKPVVHFDEDMSNALRLMEIWLQMAYEAGFNNGKAMKETLDEST